MRRLDARRPSFRCPEVPGRCTTIPLSPADGC
jgi:hypothetical protein